MQVVRAGEPRLEEPSEARLGVSHVCVVPITPAPSDEWMKHFKQCLGERLQTFREDRHTDAWSQHVRVDSDAVRFLVSGAVGSRLGEYLDLIDGVVGLTNERSRAAAERKAAAHEQAVKQAVAHNQQVTSALREWTVRNPS